MRTLVWLVEATWQACVDAAARFTPADAELILLHVIDVAAVEQAEGAYAGLFGRGRHGADPGAAIRATAEAAEGDLLTAAAARLGRPARQVIRRGRIEREVIAVAVDMDLLIVARDGDRGRPGPRSLAPPTRFVVDHAPCPVLLVWPNEPDRPTLRPDGPDRPVDGGGPHRRPTFWRS